MAAFKATRNAFCVAEDRFMLTAVPKFSLTPAVPAPVSVTPLINIVPVSVEPSLAALVITYLFETPEAEVITICSFSVIPLAASPSAIIIVAEALTPRSPWGIFKIVTSVVAVEVALLKASSKITSDVDVLFRKDCRCQPSGRERIVSAPWLSLTCLCCMPPTYFSVNGPCIGISALNPYLSSCMFVKSSPN